MIRGTRVYEIALTRKMERPLPHLRPDRREDDKHQEEDQAIAHSGYLPIRPGEVKKIVPPCMRIFQRTDPKPLPPQ